MSRINDIEIPEDMDPNPGPCYPVGNENNEDDEL